MSVVDALDYTEKWLKDTVTWLRETRAEGSDGASADAPSSPPVNVHNQAYLRLLLWDHVSDPFPEVSPFGRSRSLASHPGVILSGSFSLLAPPPTDCADGPGSLPADAAGDGAVGPAVLCAPHCLHQRRRGRHRPPEANGHAEGRHRRPAGGHAHAVSIHAESVGGWGAVGTFLVFPVSTVF